MDMLTSMKTVNLLQDMKHHLRSWMGICLMGSMVFSGVLSVPPAVAQGTPSATIPSDMKKVVYKGIEKDLFNSEDGELPPDEALKRMGLSFPQGASASYNAKKKTLTMVNTAKEHTGMEKILALFDSNKPKERTIEFIESCKVVSGKPDKKAKLFVFFCVGLDDLSMLESETCAYDGAAVYGGDKKYYKDNVKEIAGLQKKKAVEVLLLMESGCDVKKVKKMAKMLKLKAPILEQSQAEGVVYISKGDSGKVTVLDRFGKEIETDDVAVYWGLEGSNCLEVITDWLKENAQ